MKFVVLILDGAADLPIESLGGKTPLMAANCPNMDEIAAVGTGGRAHFIPDGLPSGSDVAILSIAGCDPEKYYCGRGPLEALAQGIQVRQDEIVYRCNLITITDGTIDDYSSGHIRSAESHELIKDLARELDGPEVKFYPGVDYRHILVVKDNDAAECFPPHDYTGEKAAGLLPRGPGSRRLTGLIRAAEKILEDHPVNKKRAAEGLKPANAIWPWGGGRLVPATTFGQRFGISGVVITAVDLIRGIGRAAGLDVVEVPGATGLWDTNYAGKAEAAIKALERHDFALVHVEATDEAGHEGRIDLKIKAIEDFDRLVAGPILDHLRSTGAPWRILLTADHPTPIRVRTHTRDWVPFAMAGTGISGEQKCKTFDESLTGDDYWSFDQGYLLMETFINAGDLPDGR